MAKESDIGDLEKKTQTELKQMAAEAGAEDASRMTKQEAIQAIREGAKKGGNPEKPPEST